MQSMRPGSENSPLAINTKYLGMVDYLLAWQAMKEFTANRDSHTPDEIWLLQHPSVYTQGIAGKPEHLLYQNDIPLVRTDRGGQITFHGPGQLIAYLLLDLRRLKLNVRELVRKMEGAVIDLLRAYRIEAEGRVEAPGVYVHNAKIASLGLKIKNGCCYHGIALNVDMDLTPFAAINPCGYAGLRVTQIKDLGIDDKMDVLGQKMIEKLQIKLAEGGK
ncbi:lipoyl(octanoyl) transferase LipB [Nitrosomonas communis]|uniref:lipoyl(octanoyl) transferase LipB n=1 Tax=Nitrosomonas communis TaxID=44574 RepID=UPI0026EE9652|nr:lipoyl(octanoyl) transferase LipB [Nitrosomonas communis]MCO6428355.1 lipoyl(octanoyl) transferase LipB [Nitrosomonas communis]